MKNRFRGLSESRKLQMLQMSVEEIYDAGYVSGFTQKTFEEQLAAVAKIKPKSPNQQRAELIQRAREFVEKYGDDFNFDADHERRIVHAWKIVRKGQGYVAWTGIAVCNKSDVFNEYIGKAIALARALEIDVPVEFLEAVQPDELVVGMVVRRFNFENKDLGTLKISVIDSEPFKGHYTHLLNTVYGYYEKNGDHILDDTHAQYEVPS